jgi:predicted DNA-binding protein (MmcQ/YjbR family)
MNIEELRMYCMAKKGVTEELPFDDITLVYKVMGKIFALTNTIGEVSINLKCDPELAIELREQYSSVLPGYHMNKKHWNTIIVDDSIPAQVILEWIDRSYNLVVNSLPNKIKHTLNSLS